MIRLSRSNTGQLEKDYMNNAMDVGYLGMGEQVGLFENELKDYLGCVGREVICVHSGTSALHLACQAIGLTPGDEILIPTITYVASFQAASATGATAIPCEVDPKTCLLDLEDAEKRITDKTKAIMYVQYGSNPGDLEKLYEFARVKKLRVIEDAAHSFGSTYKDRKIGSFGDVICFSFDGIKNITCGDGGAVITGDKEVANRVKDARLLGVEKDTVNRFSNKRSYFFEVSQQGWRYHMNEISASLGRAQLKRFDDELKTPRVNYSNLYREQLKDCNGVELFEMDDSKGNYIVPHIMPIKVIKEDRQKFFDYLGENGIQCGIHYFPNHRLEKYNPTGKIELPASDELFEKMLTLPLHTLMSKDDVLMVCDTIKSYFKNNDRL